MSEVKRVGQNLTDVLKIFLGVRGSGFLYLMITAERYEASEERERERGGTICKNVPVEDVEVTVQYATLGVTLKCQELAPAGQTTGIRGYISKDIRILPLGNINVWTKFHGNPSCTLKYPLSSSEFFSFRHLTPE